MVEKAVYLSDMDKVGNLDKGYDRLYFGVEFCELNIPSFHEAGKAFDTAREHGMSFTFVTPYVTDYGIEKITRLLDELAELGTMEVVVNDYGVLRLFKEGYRPLQPVFGRLLTKQKRGFGLYKGILEYPDELIDYFRSSNVDNDNIRRFLRDSGIERVEMDNLIHGSSVGLEGSGISGSLYVPYGYISTTRFCPWAFEGKSWENLKNMCKKSCSLNVLALDSETMAETIYMRGNTQFFRNDMIPTDEHLLHLGIDRLVYEPDIPI